MSVTSYRDLKVWQTAMDLAELIYQITRSFPDHEGFGLISQLRRGAVSIPSNIAEGHARTSTKEFLHHISIALGALAEIETQIILSNRLSYVDLQTLDEVLEQGCEIGRMLHGLQKSLLARI